MSQVRCIATYWVKDDKLFQFQTATDQGMTCRYSADTETSRKDSLGCEARREGVLRDRGLGFQAIVGHRVALRGLIAGLVQSLKFKLELWGVPPDEPLEMQGRAEAVPAYAFVERLNS